MWRRTDDAEPAEISAAKGQFVVNGAYPNAVNEALPENPRAIALATARAGNHRQ
jgi:hypothetical protein